MKQWFKVRVTIDFDTFEDEVLALSKTDAFYVAKWNWENARSIEVL
jgi:hypothetical protein